jgi:hypothetical protein
MFIRSLCWEIVSAGAFTADRLVDESVLFGRYCGLGYSQLAAHRLVWSFELILRLASQLLVGALHLAWVHGDP